MSYGRSAEAFYFFFEYGGSSVRRELLRWAFEAAV